MFKETKMFGILNFLYPSEKFLTSVLNILMYNSSTYDIAQLNEQLNQNEKCELLNGSIDSIELNKYLKLKDFYIEKVNIKKTTFIFKRNYFLEKTILSFEDINIDIIQKEKEDKNCENLNQEELNNEQKEYKGSFFDNIINTVIHNIEINFKNITIKFYDKQNKNVEYTFLIKNINYEQNPNVAPVSNVQKMNYLFIHNKALFIGGILLKEKFDENDNTFFNYNEGEDKNNYYDYLKKSNHLIYIKDQIEIDIFYDKDNNVLTLGNNNKSEFFIENIFNIQQINSLFKYLFPEKNKINDGQKNNIININKKENENKSMNLMGFKIEKINFDFKIWYLYFVLLQNNMQEEDIKDKLWLFSKEKSKDNIIEHYNYFKKKYYIFCINDLLFESKNRKISLQNASIKLIDAQKKFEHNHLNINNFILDLESNELVYEDFYFEINYNLLFLLKIIFAYYNKGRVYEEIQENKNIVGDRNNKEDINNININKKEKEKNLSELKIKGQNLTLKLFLNNYIGENDNDDITLNEMLFPEKYQNNFIDFIISNLSINKEENKIFLYDYINLSYNKENNTCPILKIIEHEKNDFKNNIFRLIKADIYCLS